MLFSLCACNSGNTGGKVSITSPSNTDFWGKPSDMPSQGNDNSWDPDLTPNINVTVIGGDGKKDDMIEESQSESATIYSMVTSAVTCDLSAAGFTTTLGYRVLVATPKAEKDTQYLYCKRNGAEGKGFVSAGGFTVLKGSKISDHIIPSFETRAKSYYNLRKKT